MKSNDDYSLGRVGKISLIDTSSTVPIATICVAAEKPLLKFGFWRFSSFRFRVSLLLSMFVFVHALMRANIAIGMVCMVNTTAIEANRIDYNRSSTPHCVADVSEEEKLDYEGDFLWDSNVQALVFSAMFWGGLVTGPFSGWLADKYGPKNLMLASITINIAGTWLTPLVATHWGHVGLAIVRGAMGLGQGLLIPCMASLGSRWFAPSERSMVIAIYTSGIQLATILGNPFAAFLCQQRDFLGGWPAIFYTNGLIACVFLVAWAVTITNSPEKNRFISEKELVFIKQELSDQSLVHRKLATRRIPWRQMFTSLPLLAAMLSNGAAALMINLYQIYLPTYFKQVLLLDLKSNGLFSALPFLSLTVVKFMLAGISDGLKRRGKLSNTTLSKIFNSIASFWSALCLISVGFVDCSEPGVAVALLCLSMSSFGAYASGFLTSMACIAPVFTGIVSSFGRVAGQIGAISAPYIVGVATEEGSQSEWRLVFIIVAGVQIVSGIFFLFFGSAEIQPWATESMLSPAMDGENAQPSTVDALTAEDKHRDFCAIGHNPTATTLIEDNEDNVVNTDSILLPPMNNVKEDDGGNDTSSFFADERTCGNGKSDTFFPVTVKL